MGDDSRCLPPQPDPLTAVVAFLTFALASSAMVAATLLALYGTAASGVYMIVRSSLFACCLPR